MLTPSLPDLLRGAAASLENDLLSKLDGGDAAQLAAAIDLVRKVAAALPGAFTASLADSRDIAATLARIGRPVAVELPAIELASLDAIEATNDRLRALIGEIAPLAVAPDADPALRREIADLMRRMAERETALGLV